MIRKMSMFCIGLWILVVISSTKGQNSEPKVRVAQGELRGTYVSSQATRQSFYSFQGVPYAKPPLNELRFRDAQPPEPWKGTYDATKIGSKCMQFDDSSVPGLSEDCLHLNVYTPQLPSAQSSLLPVMFWIHGGGFVTGSCSDDIYGPDYIVAEGIVLVTINYRLNIFGFLFMKDAVPANIGLKDQLAALRWVNENIAAFNGDPKQITVFGESAGAASTHWFMLSSLTEGLFQRAIGQSGSALNPWSVMDTPYETSKRLAKDVGCTEGNDREVVECLRKVDSYHLLEVALTQAPPKRDLERFFPVSFVPTWKEENPCGEETFVTAPPAELIKNGYLRDVPFLTGFNDEEWMLDEHPGQSLFSSEERLKALDSDWKKYIFPETRLPKNLSDQIISQAMDDLRYFYLDGKNLTYENLQGYKNMLSDLQIVEGLMYGAKYKAKAKKSPVYLYYFTMDDRLNFQKHLFNLSSPGASHSDELGYLFHTKSLPTVSDESPAGLVRRRIVRMWANFAKTGEPIPKTDDLLDVEWKPLEENKGNYLEIGRNLKAGNYLLKKRIAFYECFYKKYGEREKTDSFSSSSSRLLTSVITLSFCLFSYSVFLLLH